VSWIHKKPHFFNTTSWRCPPWQSKHCCHLPGKLAMMRRRMSCITFTISWWIAFWRLLMFLWGYLKPHVFTHTLPDINSLKNAVHQETANVMQDTLSRHGKCTWEMAAMPWLSWRTSPRRCIKDMRLFVNPRHWLNWPCSVEFIAVYNKCVILLLQWVMLNAAPCIMFVSDSTSSFQYILDN
jgi:hypothetical protein